MCMSCRQPPAKLASAAKPNSPRQRRAGFALTESPSRQLFFNFIHSVRLQTVQKHFGLVQIEILVPRLDHQKEPVLRSQREARHVENRMVGLRQSVQREHPE